MSTCPSCGRDPGLNTRCPHCGADLKRRVSIRTYGLIAIAVAVVGLGVLWFFATRAPIAAVKIAAIQATSNYAYVQIDGRVSRGPNYNPTAQALTFWVRDDTGEIMVSAFREVTQELIAADQVPAPGDAVSLQGTLRVREDQPSLTLDSAKSLTLEPATLNAPLREIGSLQLSDVLAGVRVQGVVRAIKNPFDGLKLITLRDATGAIDVAIPTELEPLIGATLPLTLGQSVEVAGTVTAFETTPQLSLRRGRDITALTERVEFARPTPLENITADMAGRWVRVQGIVDDVSPFSAGVRVTLSRGDKQLVVVIWQDVWDRSADQSAIEPGATLAASGEVNVFRGELEIILNNLLTNAVKYNRPGGRVTVRLTGDADRVVLAVTDTGIGLTPEEAAKLFNDFVRIRNDKTRDITGSGLGLSVVRKLALLYGGDATVTSTPDVGSTFTVTLRRTAKPPVVDDGKSRTAPLAAGN